MIVHHTFTSEANGRYYPAGFFVSELEYQELSASDRNYIDRPEINMQLNADFEADEQLMFDEDMRAEADYERQSYRDDRFDNDNEDALREQDDWDRVNETGPYDYRND